jgi:hypothetical protein
MSTDRSAEDIREDADGDPEMMKGDQRPEQQDQPEGEDDSSETGSA